ncbi:MAG: hypothetical protein JW807_00205 [Spirochaetes bacterium]|nr:hypothetical protein [Spirochaetota bacterium]
MAKENIQDKRFPFLHSHVAREPHIYEVLTEIMSFQNNVLKTDIGHFAGIEDLKTSRNIKIPFTIARNKIIINLVDILTRNYPEFVRKIITFTFSVEPDTKKLSIIENHEYTVMLSNEDFNRFQAERNAISAENFLNLIAQFRLFNLTKLLKKTRERTLLSQVIKLELGKGVFTYKNFAINRQNVEVTEDFCFHRDNYEPVKKSLNLEKFNKIIINHSAQILRRLKNFGILNTDFSDYHDNKLDYILNVLLQDIYLSLSDSELTEVKNFNSLRSCLLKVDTLIDPLITASNDIASYVRENRICAASTISSVFDNLGEEKILQWAQEKGERYKIITFKDEADIIYLIDGTYLLPRMTELHDKILFQQENIAGLGHAERSRILDEVHLLCNVGKKLLSTEDKLRVIIDSDDGIARLRQIIIEYEQYQNSLAMESAVGSEDRESRKKRSIIDAISQFFRSLFGGRKEPAASVSRDHDQEAGAYRPVSTGEAKNIISTIRSSSSPLIALSSHIELIPANEKEIDAIINDLRKLNLKIVVPVYNARKILYPNRSQQYLISDIEYVLVDPDVIQSPETIRKFTDSLAGEKIKDEKISGTAILTIEKYLKTLHFQKKAQLLKKAKLKK